ncbi:reverse transcriptase domain-containing protein [Tanacetum coccineum]
MTDASASVDRLGQFPRCFVHSRACAMAFPECTSSRSDSEDKSALSTADKSDPDASKIFETGPLLKTLATKPVCGANRSIPLLVGKPRGTGSANYQQSMMGFEELRRAFRLNFIKGKKWCQEPCELRQGETAPGEVHKAPTFRALLRVSPNFDELIERHKSFIQGDSRRHCGQQDEMATQTDRSQEQSLRQSIDQSIRRNQQLPPRSEGRWGGGNDKYTPLTNTQWRYSQKERFKLPKTTHNAPPKEQRRNGNGFATIDKLVKGRQIDSPDVKNIKEGEKDNKGAEVKMIAPRRQGRPHLYGCRHGIRRTKQKTSISFAWEPKHMDWCGPIDHRTQAEKSDKMDYSPLRQRKRWASLQSALRPFWRWYITVGAGVPIHVSRQSLPSVQKTLKKCTKKGDFRWTTEAEEAFMQLKQHIAALPTLVAPRPGEELIMYLSATHGAISVVLLTDRDSVQTPVYFISKALKETEINYSAMEKLILALVFAAKRLRRYFQAHPIVVITDQPIKQVISKPDASGRLQKWSVLLGEHNISYRPRTAVKGQILADFLIEKPETDAVLPQSEVKLQEPWILFTDGSSCVDGSGAGLILTNPEGMEFTYALRFEFTATNNEAEYEALLAGLRIAARMGVRNLEANVDSRLVANHVLGEYVAKEDNMIQYLDKTKSLIQGFDRFTIRQVPRGDNKKADALSKIASTSFAHLSKQVLVEILKNKSISEMEISTVIEEQDPTWMTPIIEFISKGTLPHEQKDARRIRRTAQRFELRNGVLYRRSFLQPWLRCVGPIQADYVLREIHAGSCSMHSGPRSVVARALRSGYYWPTMHRDARDMIKKCNDCQVHRPIPRQPQQELTPITSPWPFHKWGIDIAGPFPVAAGGLKFLIVAIDYFTKWIEAKAVATITGNQVKRFVWDNIVCRFGLPGEIVSDNGKQFCDNPFKDWCARLSITQRFASVKHPQTNGLVERANQSLGEGIKARLDRHKGRWVEELSHVLWAHRTTITRSKAKIHNTLDTNESWCIIELSVYQIRVYNKP